MSVSPILFENQTTMYVIDYENGWDIIAADKRIHHILASSVKGSFYKDINPAVKSWINSTSEEMFNLQQSKGSTLKQSERDIESNMAFWKLINADTEFITGKESSNVTKAHPPIIPVDPIPQGHYELTNVISREVLTDTLDHIMPTHWSQTYSSCNCYIPYRTDIVGVRAPAGCVAVAGAQVLYYLNQRLGRPLEMPCSARCEVDINYYRSHVDSLSFGNSYSGFWSDLRSYGNETFGNPYAGILIAWVAKNVGMEFGNTDSKAHTQNLRGVFNLPSIGINSDYLDYDKDDVITNLQNYLPVIVRASLSSDNKKGHSFVIDGYVIGYTETTFVYDWVWDNVEPDQEVSIVVPLIEHEYTSSTTKRFLINWGWSDSNDAALFSLNGPWTTSGHTTFNNNKKMLCNFRLMTN